VASLSQGRTAAAQCGLFTYKSVPVIFEPPCTIIFSWQKWLRKRATMLRVPISIILLYLIFFKYGLAAGILTKTV